MHPDIGKLRPIGFKTTAPIAPKGLRHTNKRSEYGKLPYRVTQKIQTAPALGNRADRNGE